MTKGEETAVTEASSEERERVNGRKGETRVDGWGGGPLSAGEKAALLGGSRHWGAEEVE